MTNARRTFGAVGLVIGIAATVGWHRSGPGESATAEPIAKRLVFLTRDGCVNTTVMRRNLDEALKALGEAAVYEMVDQDMLSESDVRRGYPTPTLLYADRDIFGMSVPKLPLPGPT